MKRVRITRLVADNAGFLDELWDEIWEDGQATLQERAMYKRQLGGHVVLTEKTDHRFRLAHRLLDGGDVDRGLVADARSLHEWCEKQKAPAMVEIARAGETTKRAA